MSLFTVDFSLEPTPPVIDDAGLVHSGESDRGGHQLEAAVQCPRAWSYKYAIGVERVECPSPGDKVPAWVLGTLVHQWLANYYGHGMIASAPPDDATGIRAERLGYPEAARDACVLAEAYCGHVIAQRPEWRPIAVEPQILCDFGAAGPFTSGADIVFWDAITEEPVIVDWKTAGRVETAPGYAYSAQYLRYRMILRNLARKRGKPDTWGRVFVGLIPTGKTNYDKRDLIECPYFPDVIDGIESQTRDDLMELKRCEADPKDAVSRPRYGAHCHGPYSGCAFRRDYCFVNACTR